jgi:Fic family protein
MKIPMPPPNVEQLFAQLTPDELAKIFQHANPLPAGKYMHWDDLRHRPPPAGLSAEKWWLAVALARGSILQPLPFVDKEAKPFRFATPTPLLVHLHHIDRDAAGHIKTAASSSMDENRERYLLRSLIEESITSSQLEGASTTRNVAEAMLREKRQPRDRSETMIFNNYQAMQQLRHLKDEKITPEHILELHRTITRDTLDDPADAGRLRESDDVNVVDNRDGKLLHQPPSFTELPERLDRLCAFANADPDSSPFVHPVLRAILVHFMIGYDHPFADGNGRTARALFYWSMARSGYWLMEFLSISQFLRDAPRQYVQAYLHSETDRNDTTYFLLHQLDIIRRSIAGLHDYLGRKIQEQKEAERLLIKTSQLGTQLNHRQLALLTHALKHPGERYLLAKHQTLHGVVYQTARADLLGLEKLGLLIKLKQGNAFVFYAADNLAERFQQLNLA